MSSWQVVFVLTLVAVCSSLEYKPVYYPGPCPQIPSSARFNQKDLEKLWYDTHLSNPSFDGIRCATFNFSGTPIGLQFDFKFLNASGVQETYVNQLNATGTPGVYNVAYTIPSGAVVYGTQVFYLYDASESTASHESHEGHEDDENMYVLSWACVDEQVNKQHVECAGIHSQRKNTPLSAVKVLQRHLKSHGSPVEEFYQIDNKNC